MLWLNSYSHLSDMVDHLFPPCQQSCSDSRTHSSCLPGASKYSTFTYWRNPLPDVDNELTDFIKNRDASIIEKNGDTKKHGMAGKKATSLPAWTAATVTDHFQ